MHRTPLYAALLLMLATPAAFAQQADAGTTATPAPAAKDSRDNCLVIEAAAPDADGKYRAVLECTRPSDATPTPALSAVTMAAGDTARGGGGSTPPADTDGLDYFSSNGPSDGTDQSVAGVYSVAMGPYTSALGNESVGIGYDTFATGEWTVAIGRSASAMTSRDIAIGQMAYAQGNGAIAIGGATNWIAGWHNTQATGAQSTAVGTASVASGNFSTAIGTGAVAEGEDATAVGEAAVARGEQATAMGLAAYAQGMASSVFGVGAYAGGESASAFGSFSSAEGNYSSAIGTSAFAAYDYANAFGSFAEAGAFASTAVGVGALSLRANSTVLGGAYFVGASDDGSSWGGELVRSIADGQGATAIGAGAQAHADQATAMGTLSQALGLDSMALGAQSMAEAESATAIGNYSNALGTGSTAAGYGAIARGEYATASGYNAAAIGDDSTAMGDGSDAEGVASVALGAHAQALGDNAVALGANSVADRANSVSIGADGAERQLTHVADGTEDFDAVNVRQLRAAGLVDADGSTLQAVTYDSTTADRVSFGGAGGTTLTNVHAGLVGANSTDAVNGAQMYGFGQSFVSALGGGAMFNGTFTGPSFNVMGSVFGNVGDALAAIDHGIAAIETRVTNIEQHGLPGGGGDDSHVDVDGGAPGTDDAHAGTGTGGVAIGSDAHASGSGGVAVGSDATATATGSVALGQGSVADRANTVSVGSQGHERQVTNVAAGTADTDAANVGQMNAADAQTLADANAYTDLRFGELVAAPMQAVGNLRAEMNDRFEQTDKRIDQMGAMNAAMLNMATSAAGVNQVNRLGVGAGFSGGQQALSIGYQRLVNSNTTITIGGAFSSDEASAGVGVGIGW